MLLLLLLFEVQSTLSPSIVNDLPVLFRERRLYAINYIYILYIRYIFVSATGCELAPELTVRLAPSKKNF